MHKKLLSVLLALVMILSVLPMAAFAEEAEHTHDETCGCVSVLTACTHPQLTLDKTSAYYSNFSDSQHKVTYYNVYICDVCGDEITLDPYTEYAAHIIYTVQVDSGLFEGDSYVVYKKYCNTNCGYFKYETHWIYGTITDGWFQG